MSTTPGRKKKPDIIRKEDVCQAPVQPGHGGEIRETDRNSPSHQERTEWSKLRFGQWLIIGCLVTIVVLSVGQYLLDAWQPPWMTNREPTSRLLDATVELLKLVTTTALGFVFAKVRMNSEDR